MSWPTKSLAEVADFQLGKMLDQVKNRGDNHPYLANKNVRWGSFDFSELREMRFEESEFERFSLKDGDIVMCEGGEPGRCALWRDEMPNMMFQKALHRIRPFENMDSVFLYYNLSYRAHSGHFRGLFTGATIKHLPREKLALVQVDVPDLPTQKRIASILSAYDDLIENNRRRIVLLEQAARLLYREWFVHLRFPGHETIKIIDGLPEGWESIPASEAMQINPRTTWKATESKLITMVPMGALSTAGMICDTSLFENREQPTSVKFMNGDTLFARITPCLENGKTGYVNFLQDGEIACGSTEFVVFREHRISRFMAYLLAREEDFRKNAITSMVGSSGRQRVQQNCFEKYIVSAPPRKIVQDFDAAIEPMFQEIGHLQKVITKLTRARDLLLPRLMDGRIPV
ncbi:restriction endonuclease subunit S [Paenochrobactrum pullorum]|uniref:restriction endonuclease subunit S n=1 Tax=Paenochrobactrum pullorum TaxID=1324351 RepID=UPI0035BC0D33